MLFLKCIDYQLHLSSFTVGKLFLVRHLKIATNFYQEKQNFYQIDIVSGSFGNDNEDLGVFTKVYDQQVYKFIMHNLL